MMNNKEKKTIEQFIKLQQQYDEAIRYNQTDDQASKLFPRLAALRKKALAIKEKYGIS